MLRVLLVNNPGQYVTHGHATKDCHQKPQDILQHLVRITPRHATRKTACVCQVGRQDIGEMVQQ